MSNTNNNANNTNTKEKPDNSLEKEEQVKASKSAAQQVIDLQEQIKDLKIELQTTEAKVQAIINILNNALQAAEGQTNRIHKELQKQIVGMCEWTGESLTKLISEQMQKMENLPAHENAKLSMTYRQSLGKAPIMIEGQQQGQQNQNRR